MFPVWLVISFAIIVLLAGCVVVTLYRRQRVISPFTVSESVDSLELDLVRRLPPSPITQVSFFDALHSQALVLRADDYVREGLSRALSGDGMNIAVQSCLLSSNELTLVYKFSENATSLYRSGQASIPLHGETGRLLPWMMDNHGSVIEQAKGASMFTARLASAWALVVSSAHIISGLDIVKRLDKVRVVLFVSAAVIIGLIGLSRIYLGVHYPSDVVAGYLAGAIWVSSMVLVDRLRRTRQGVKIATVPDDRAEA